MHEEGRKRFKINKYLSIPLFHLTLLNLSYLFPFGFIDHMIYSNLMFVKNSNLNILIRHVRAGEAFRGNARASTDNGCVEN